jgi:hypothetical protein
MVNVVDLGDPGEAFTIDSILDDKHFAMGRHQCGQHGLDRCRA